MEKELYLSSAKDPIVESVVQKLRSRSAVGIKKYGTTLEDNNELSVGEWVEFAQEEVMDFILYLEKLKEKIRDAEL